MARFRLERCRSRVLGWPHIIWSWAIWYDRPRREDQLWIYWLGWVIRVTYRVRYAPAEDLWKEFSK